MTEVKGRGLSLATEVTVYPRCKDSRGPSFHQSAFPVSWYLPSMQDIWKENWTLTALKSGDFIPVLWRIILAEVSGGHCTLNN